MQAGLLVSSSWGPVFRRYLLNGQTDQDETWAQDVSSCDLIFRDRYTLITKNPKFKGLAIGS